jgi:hypothetical protein
VELWEFFIHYSYPSHVIHTICKYFLPFHGLSFHSDDSVLLS